MCPTVLCGYQKMGREGAGCGKYPPVIRLATLNLIYLLFSKNQRTSSDIYKIPLKNKKKKKKARTAHK
jgi:hypothetical protein